MANFGYTIAVNGKLLVLDIDATLVPDGARIVPPENVEAIAAARRQGYRVALATTRNYRPTQAIAQQLSLDDIPLICHGGAYIVRADGTLISHTPLDADFTREVAEHADSAGYRLVITVNEKNYLPQYYAPERDAPFEDLVVVGSNREALVGAATRIATLDEAGSHVCYRQYGADPRACMARFYRGDTLYCVGILHPRATKGNAVRTLCRHLGMDTKDVIAMGDSEVDISMFEVAGCSVAMPLSFDHVKQAASLVAPAGKPAVAWVIDRLLSGTLVGVG